VRLILRWGAAGSLSPSWRAILLYIIKDLSRWGLLRLGSLPSARGHSFFHLLLLSLLLSCYLILMWVGCSRRLPGACVGLARVRKPRARGEVNTWEVLGSHKEWLSLLGPGASEGCWGLGDRWLGSLFLSLICLLISGLCGWFLIAILGCWGDTFTGCGWAGYRLFGSIDIGFLPAPSGAVLIDVGLEPSVIFEDLVAVVTCSLLSSVSWMITDSSPSRRLRSSFSGTSWLFL
jgi:hypothetical protein